MDTESKEDLCQRTLDILLRFGAIINSSLKIEEVLDIAMKWAEEFMDAEASSVYELDEEKNLLFVRLARGEKKEPIQRITLKVGEGIAGHVIMTGKPMVIQDVHGEKRFSDKYDRVTGFKTRSLISVPLILRDKSVGVLQVINKRFNRPFTDADLELLTSMAQQITGAIENAKLYQRLEEKFSLTAQELKLAQQKLIRAGRLAAMDHLIQGVAHEIRNPVTTIGGFARRIRKELGKNKTLRKYADIILDESRRLEELVDRVHQFVEIQSANLAFQHLSPIIEKVLGDFAFQARKQGVVLLKDLPIHMPPVKVDALQIVIALSNVVQNALESMPKEGTLTLKVKNDKTSLVISVSDTGCGIADSRMESIYDPFVTSKTRGVGLGLTLVHQIVMNHHGEIDIRSVPDRGTTVTIRLPVDRELV